MGEEQVNEIYLADKVRIISPCFIHKEESVNEKGFGRIACAIFDQSPDFE